jgi:hypothetical protein
MSRRPPVGARAPAASTPATGPAVFSQPGPLPAAQACAWALGALEALSGRGGPGPGTGGSDDPAQDVYSVAVSLYQALTGRPPSATHANGAFPAPVHPPELDLVLRRALVPDRRFRYRSPADFAVELGAVATRMFGPRSTVTAPGGPAPLPGALRRAVPAAPAARRRRPEGTASTARALAGAIAIVVGIAVLAGWQAGWPTTVFGAPPAGGAHAGAPLPTARGWGAVTLPGAAAPSPPALAPTGAGSGQGATVLSCPSASFCVAVGGSSGPLGSAGNELYTLSSGSWTVTAAATSTLSPPAAAGPALDAVSCPVAGWCVAVGSYHDGSGVTRGVIETLSHGSWRARTAPGTGLSGILDGVTCSAVGSCVAIGRAGSVAGIWQLSSGAWTETPAPTVGLEPTSGTSYPPRLASVSCPSSLRCVAVGTYYAADGTELGLTETMRSGVWSASTVPAVAGTTSSRQSSLQLVSCPMAAFCVAFGSIFDAEGYLHGLVDTLSGGLWTSSEVSVGTGGPSSSSREWMYPNSLDCPSTSFCLATGWYFASSTLDEARSFVLVLSGGTWRTQLVQMHHVGPPTGSLDVVPLASSCRAPDRCVVVGSYYDSSGEEHGLVETLGRQGWQAASAPVAGLHPAIGARFGSGLGAVSCPPGTTCFAVGTYRDVAGAVHGVMAKGLG